MKGLPWEVPSTTVYQQLMYVCIYIYIYIRASYIAHKTRVYIHTCVYICMCVYILIRRVRGRVKRLGDPKHQIFTVFKVS